MGSLAHTHTQNRLEFLLKYCGSCMSPKCAACCIFNLKSFCSLSDGLRKEVHLPVQAWISGTDCERVEMRVISTAERLIVSFNLPPYAFWRFLVDVCLDPFVENAIRFRQQTCNTSPDCSITCLLPPLVHKIQRCRDVFMSST